MKINQSESGFDTKRLVVGGWSWQIQKKNIKYILDIRWGQTIFFIKQIVPFSGEITKEMSISHIFSMIFASFFMLEQLFK